MICTCAIFIRLPYARQGLRQRLGLRLIVIFPFTVSTNVLSYFKIDHCFFTIGGSDYALYP